jgi:hypothetical protein
VVIDSDVRVNTGFFLREEFRKVISRELEKASCACACLEYRLSDNKKGDGLILTVRDYRGSSWTKEFIGLQQASPAYVANAVREMVSAAYLPN